MFVTLCLSENVLGDLGARGAHKINIELQKRNVRQ